MLTDGSQRDSKTYMHMAGYVVQDDIVMGTLTVRENLLFSARLRLPGGVDDEEKRRRVQEVIEELGLEKVSYQPLLPPLLFLRARPPLPHAGGNAARLLSCSGPGTVCGSYLRNTGAQDGAGR